MTIDALSKKVKAVALAHGADLMGLLRVANLIEHTNDIHRILPTARSVMVVAARHSVSAVCSANIQMAQFDTMYTYSESARAAHAATRFLESEGFSSVAVPAFIPIDMQEPKKGMKGEICWRRAGVRSGIVGSPFRRGEDQQETLWRRHF